MNKKVYTVLGFVPVVGKLIQNKTNFFALKGSQFMDDFTKTSNYKILTNWMKANPTKILTYKVADKLINKK